MKCVILAGGKGTRMSRLYPDIPKALIEIGEIPVILREILALKKEGVTEFIIITGYKGDMIRSFLKDGKEHNVKTEYIDEKVPLGTAGSLSKINIEEDFLLINGDLVFDFCLEKMVAFHKRNQALVTIFSHPSSHIKDSMLLSTTIEGRVKSFQKYDEYTIEPENLASSGIYILSPTIFKNKETVKSDLDKDIIKPLIKTGKVYSYKSTEYVKDMGTPERKAEVCLDIIGTTVSARNLRKKQKAIFLDRDGTINKYKGYITKREDIELLDGISEAINSFHKSGYIVIVITNQPIIARGECTEEELKQIHNRLQLLLNEKGAYLDDIFFCPHHPDKGFENEIPHLKTECNCRKPKSGMINEAIEKYNIDVSKSYMVGDKDTDMLCGINAGCKVIKIGEVSKFSKITFPSVFEFSVYLEHNTPI